MRWRPVVLGGTMTAVGVAGTAVGGVAGWLVSPGAFMIAALGATLALLGVGLIPGRAAAAWPAPPSGRGSGVAVRRPERGRRRGVRRP
ncbi:hypothetical protein [Micromonospora sp. NPDC002717]|uniref:hypothetical protein n=1 Tax=Micromonospora sp. NPDC002717 TaxID=3154424 RepID=UPI003316E807